MRIAATRSQRHATKAGRRRRSRAGRDEPGAPVVHAGAAGLQFPRPDLPGHRANPIGRGLDVRDRCAPNCRISLSELATELDPEFFWQIHRGTIVNVDAVAVVHRKGNGTLELRLKHHPHVLTVSAPYAHLFKQM